MIIIIAGIALFLVTLMCLRWRVYPLHIALATQVPILAGFVSLDERSGSHFAVWYLFSMLALAAGCFLAMMSHRQTIDVRPRSSAPLPQVSVRQTYLFSALIVGLVVYHFSIVGLPIFSAHVETARFDFAGSGLLGIPGRMYQFGLPFVLVYVSVQYERFPTASLRRLKQYLWIFFGLIEVASGFKGAIFSLVLIYLELRCFIGTPLQLLSRSTWKIISGALVGTVFAVLMAQQYTSLQTTTAVSALTFLWERMTLLAAEPGYYVLTYYSQHPHLLYAWVDLHYFILKYFHTGSLISAFTFNQTVSSALYSTSLRQTSFIVSVTVGAFSELSAYFGLIVAIMTMFGVGYIFALSWIMPQELNSLFLAGSSGLGCTMWSAYVLNGNLVYILVNFTLVLGVLLLLYGLAGFLSLVSGGPKSIAHPAQSLSSMGAHIRYPQGGPTQ